MGCVGWHAATKRMTPGPVFDAAATAAGAGCGWRSEATTLPAPNAASPQLFASSYGDTKRAGVSD